jgi:hypothetical protein
MKTSLVPNTAIPVVEGWAIERPEDALDLIAACYEHAACSVLLDGSSLPDSFFDLRTRFAGDFVQKLVTYQLRVAAVFPMDGAYSERFRGYIGEARNGPQFRTFVTRESALAWLVAA